MVLERRCCVLLTKAAHPWRLITYMPGCHATDGVARSKADRSDCPARLRGAPPAREAISGLGTIRSVHVDAL